MGTSGPSREEGEIDFSSDELAEMQVDVAGREETAASPRKKRALRVPADEVVRTVKLTTEPDLEALPASAGEEADELVEHAFDNGGRSEAEVAAQLRFAVPEADRRSSRDEDDEDLAPEISVSSEKPGRAEMVQAISKLPPNVRALMRALVPEPEADASGATTEVTHGEPHADPDGDPSLELEQLDSSELEAVDTREGDAPEQPEKTDEQPAPRRTPPTMPLLLKDEDHEPELTIEESGPHTVEAAADAEEVAADDVTVDEEPDEDTSPRRAAPPATPPAMPPATPPAMPAEAAPRQRSITPLMTPTMPSGLFSPATAPLAPPPPPQNDDGLRPRRRRRVKQWFEEIFDDDYLRTLPYLSARQTEREAAFVTESLGLDAGSSLLDVGCGYGRHAMELAGRGFQVTGIDLSLPLLIRAADAARRIGVAVNFVHGDMREMTFDAEFDGAYCLFTSFGYFDDDTNRKVAANLQRALKPGGRVLIELCNRDYITRDLPTRVWWQGEGCVVLEEVDFNYFSSRLQVQRSIIFEDGRQVEQEISIRAYSLHEIGKVLHHAGFRVIEVSGGLGLRGKFFGAHSRQLLVLAEKKPAP